MRFSQRLFLIIVSVFVLLFPPFGQHLVVAGSMPSNMAEHPESNGQGFTVWSIGGTWTCDGKPTSITQDGGGNLVFTNEMGSRSKGRFLNTETVIAIEWEGGLHGSVQDGGKTIRWANGTVWRRILPESGKGGGTITIPINPNDSVKLGSGGGSGSLGVRWDERENGFSGVWTRRGTSDVFDAVWDVNGRQVTAVLTMTWTGSDTVSIYRKDTSDSLEVDYTATIGKDGSVTGSGKVRSTGLAFNWTASVR
jgi:hypothetical protein